MSTAASFDRELGFFALGARVVVGMDEVGRGPWAGPLVIGACAVTPELVATAPAGLADSKLLTPRRREALAPIIQAWSPVSLGWVAASEIDELGMAACLRLAAARALAGLVLTPDHIIQDGSSRWVPLTVTIPITVEPKLDLLCSSVAAASIVAKVARDAHMNHLATLFPTHPALGTSSGYGTSAQAEQIVAHGLTPVHRRTWAFVAKLRPDLAP
jgi:ribonuclease HII